MTKKQIQVGKTYIGKDGRHKTVTHIVDIGGKTEVWTIDHDKGGCNGTCGMSQFCVWAVREDTSGEAMRVWTAARNKRRDRQAAEGRKEVKRRTEEKTP